MADTVNKEQEEKLTRDDGTEITDGGLFDQVLDKIANGQDPSMDDARSVDPMAIRDEEPEDSSEPVDFDLYGDNKQQKVKQVLQDEETEEYEEEVEETEEDGNPSISTKDLFAEGETDTQSYTEETEEDEVSEDGEDDQETNEEIEELVNNPHTKDKTRRRIQALLKDKKELKEKLEELEAKVKEAPTSDDSEEVASIREQNEQLKQELSVFRRRYDLENDPEIAQKYDEKIKLSKSTIDDILLTNGLPEESREIEEEDEDTGEIKKYKTISLKLINDEGGFLNYIKKNPQSYRRILESIDKENPAEADIIRTKVAEMRSLEKAKEIEIQKLSQESKNYFEEQQNAQKKRVEEYQAFLEATKQQASKELPFLQEKEIPVGIEADKAKAIKAHNDKVKSLRSKFEYALNPPSLQDGVEVAKAAVYAYHLSDQLKSANERIKSMEDELKKIKNARVLKPKARATSSGTNERKIETPTSIDDAFNFVATM